MKKVRNANCEEFGHNYFQLHGDKGPVPTLACSKCGNIVNIAEQKAA